jgi:phosphate-selective porin OprO/OprP
MKRPLITAALVSALVAGSQTAMAWEDTYSSKILSDAKGGFERKSANGNFTFKIGGRLQLDFNSYDGVLNTQRMSISEIGSSQDKFFVRRARLTLSGTLFSDWVYVIEPNYYESREEWDLADVFIGYTGFGNMAKITFGQQKRPFSYSILMSSNYLGLHERPGFGSIVEDDLRPGLVLSGVNEKWSYAVGVFEDADKKDGDTGVGASGRVTVSPINSDTRLLHLGGSYFYRSSLKSSWSPRMGIRKADRMKVTYDESDYRDGYGLELVGKYGPVWFQSEYFKASSEPWLPGARGVSGYESYVEGGWFLTGESRPYQKGLFRGVTPRANYGAFELVLRYEYTNLAGDGLTLIDRYADEFDTVTDRGNKSEIFTLGLNWYINQFVRFSLNYVNTDVKQAIAGEDNGRGVSGRIWLRF